MLIRRDPPDSPKPSEVTDKKVYLSRRQLMVGAAGLVTVANGALLHGLLGIKRHVRTGQKMAVQSKSPLSTSERLTPYEHVTGYNNFYEFSTSKYGPSHEARGFVTRPWTVTIEGAVKARKVLSIDEILKLCPLEERIYRLRCVEGWSMVIPWIGFPLAELLKQVEPTGQAKFVQFTTLYDKKRMPEQERDVLDWPYLEGLRLDEAMHPLTLLAVGLYGEVLPNQNGAPLRLVVPWKYGFKSIKSIVNIELVEEQPRSTWMRAAPDEYGFYSNVNPQVPHPRWSQARERRLGEMGKRDTILYNGYGEQVAHLYAGMDLKKNF